jgi:hypothetical protein
MALVRLAAVVIGRVDDEVAGVERRRELTQRMFLARALQPL